MVRQNPIDMIDDTREKLLVAAHNQFAERGFHGASIALIAGEVGLTKQALLYHFKRKDDLYREVLHRISVRLFEAVRKDDGVAATPAERFEDVILSIFAAAVENPLDTKVLMHELLEDRRRDAPQDDWFFKTWLDEIIALLDAAREGPSPPFADKVAQVYLLVSAIQFYAASGSLLTRFYGADEYRKIGEFYPRELRDLVRRMIASQ
ncbi:MAG: TetR/AcrR family transcriptional regulator [Pseudomonadota bacterium]